MSTNSITQGEQVGQLWPSLLDKYGLEIIFAYKSFKWNSEAKGKAQVTVIILGLSKKEESEKRLFDIENDKIFENHYSNISPYLIGFDKPTPIVTESSKPLNTLHKIVDGAVPLDGGNLTFTDAEKDEFLIKEPNAKKWLRPFVNAEDFINGKNRWVLTLKNITSQELKKLSAVCECLDATSKYRASCKRPATQAMADKPTLFAWGCVPENPFLLIPRVTSENRKYIPIGYMEPPAIPSNATMVIQNASIELFGLLTSKMHMIWLRTVGGKLETRLRYSAGMVYNTFPTPKGDLDSLEPLAQKILDVRGNEPNSTLADLYDPTTMPPDLTKAHKSLDVAVEKLYQDKPFESDEERLQFLFEEYSKMVSSQTTLE